MLNLIDGRGDSMGSRPFHSSYLIRLILGAICCLSTILLLPTPSAKAASLSRAPAIQSVDIRCYMDPIGNQSPTSNLVLQINQQGKLEQFQSIELISSNQPLSLELQGELKAIRAIRDIKERQSRMVGYIQKHCPFSILLQTADNAQFMTPKTGSSQKLYRYRPLGPTLSRANKIMVNQLKNLIVFDLIISLEWEPAPNESNFWRMNPNLHTVAGLSAHCDLMKTMPVDTPPYIQDMLYSLCRSSELLYRATDGQVALGKVEINTAGNRWDEADIRVHASNTHHPVAMLNGVNSDLAQSAVWLGRCWNGQNTSCYQADNLLFQTNWSEYNGASTLTHELSHYLLGLGDAYYINTMDGPQPRECSTSLMDNHYVGGPVRFWEKKMNHAPSCEETEHSRIYGKRADWTVLTEHYPTLSIPGNPMHYTSPNAGQYNMAVVNTLFQFQIMSGSNTTSDPSVDLMIDGGAVDQVESAQPEIYAVVQSSQDAFYSHIEQATAQGTAGNPATDLTQFNNLDEALILGVYPEHTRLHAAANVYPTCEESGQRFVYPAPEQSLDILSDGLNKIILSKDQWLPTLQFEFATSGNHFTEMTVRLTSATPTSAVHAQLCAPGMICSPPQLLSGGETTFSPPILGMGELPSYSVVRVYSKLGEAYSTVRYLGELEDLSPGNTWAFAALDGDVMVTALADYEVDGHVFVTSIVNSEMLQKPLDCGGRDGIRVIKPLGNVHVVSKEPLKSPISLQWSYDKEALDQFRGEGSQLGLLYSDSAEKGSWEIRPVRQPGDSQERGQSDQAERGNPHNQRGKEMTNWFSTGPISHGGIFMLVEIPE